MEYVKDETVTVWKQVSKERQGDYTISINTAIIDIGILMITIVEKDGEFVNSHQSIIAKPRMPQPEKTTE